MGRAAHSGGSQGPPGPARIAQGFRVRLVILGGVAERSDPIRKRVLQFCECVLHAWCGRRLRDARLMPCQFEQLGEATFVITR